jgi:3-isopropylmalate/(R)-2-methylmalate dehydratase small subunit
MAKVILKLGNDISTDDIYPGRFMATVLPSETPQFCFFDRAEFNAKLKPRPFRRLGIVGWRETSAAAPAGNRPLSALKGYELAVVAKSIARIFLQNSINLGLQVVICPGIEASEGDELEITASEVLNRTTGKAFDHRETGPPPARHHRRRRA